MAAVAVTEKNMKRGWRIEGKKGKKGKKGKRGKRGK
jgi:hypothetical protein